MISKTPLNKTYLLELREGDAFYRTEDNSVSLCYRAVQMIWPNAQRRIELEVSDTPFCDAKVIELDRGGGCTTAYHPALDKRQVMLGRVVDLIEGHFGYVDTLYVQVTYD